MRVWTGPQGTLKVSKGSPSPLLGGPRGFQRNVRPEARRGVRAGTGVRRCREGLGGWWFQQQACRPCFKSPLLLSRAGVETRWGGALQGEPTSHVLLRCTGLHPQTGGKPNCVCFEMITRAARGNLASQSRLQDRRRGRPELVRSAGARPHPPLEESCGWSTCTFKFAEPQPGECIGFGAEGSLGGSVPLRPVTAVVHWGGMGCAESVAGAPGVESSGWC